MGRNRQRITDYIADTDQAWAVQALEEQWELEHDGSDDDMDAEQESIA
jgi:hypothetical protein